MDHEVDLMPYDYRLLEGGELPVKSINDQILSFISIFKILIDLQKDRIPKF